MSENETDINVTESEIKLSPKTVREWLRSIKVNDILLSDEYLNKSILVLHGLQFMINQFYYSNSYKTAKANRINLIKSLKLFRNDFKYLIYDLETHFAIYKINCQFISMENGIDQAADFMEKKIQSYYKLHIAITEFLDLAPSSDNNSFYLNHWYNLIIYIASDWLIKSGIKHTGISSPAGRAIQLFEMITKFYQIGGPDGISGDSIVKKRKRTARKVKAIKTGDKSPAKFVPSDN